MASKESNIVKKFRDIALPAEAVSQIRRVLFILLSHFMTKVHFVSLLWEDKPSVVANRATIPLGPLS